MARLVLPSAQPPFDGEQQKWAKQALAAISELSRSDADNRSAIRQAASTAGNAASTAQGAIDTARENERKTSTMPAAPDDVVVSFSPYWDATGEARVRASFSWSQVTIYDDGLSLSEASPVVLYQVWSVEPETSYVVAEATPPESPTSGLAFITPEPVTASAQNLLPDTEYTFIVRSRTLQGVWGNFGADIVATTPSPVEPPLKPTAPTTSEGFGAAVVGWDGNVIHPVDGVIAAPSSVRSVRILVATAAAGPYSESGSSAYRGDAANINGLTVGTTYWFKLVAVNSAGIESTPSAATSLLIKGVDLGDLDESVGEAIEAAKAAALAAQGSVNLLGDPSFEVLTEEFWALGTDVTRVTTNPRTGARSLRAAANGVAHEVYHYQIPLVCDPGESYHYRVFALPAASAGTDFEEGALELVIYYGPTPESTTLSEVVGSSQSFGTVYEALSGTWKAPAGARFFRPALRILDSTSDNVYYLDDARVYRMTGESLLVNGSVVTDKIASEAIIAGKIAAGAVTAVAIQAGAVTAEKIKADAVTANAIKAGSIESNHLTAGAVQTNHLSPAVGAELDISANGAVNIIVGQIADVQDGLEDTTTSLEEMQTFYSFGADGAVVGKPGSPFALALRNDRIEMLENGNVVSYWNSGQMHVSQFVGESVILGNHKLEKYGTGTVVRAL